MKLESSVDTQTQTERQYPPIANHSPQQIFFRRDKQLGDTHRHRDTQQPAGLNSHQQNLFRLGKKTKCFHYSKTFGNKSKLHTKPL